MYARAHQTRRVAGESGQAAAELVAVVPILVALVLVLGQAAVAGHAAWSAANAARAGARAAHVGGDAERAALSALPEHLHGSVEVGGESGIEVKVRAPALVPGLPSVPLSASASLDPMADEDG